MVVLEQRKCEAIQFMFKQVSMFFSQVFLYISCVSVLLICFYLFDLVLQVFKELVPGGHAQLVMKTNDGDEHVEHNPVRKYIFYISQNFRNLTKLYGSLLTPTTSLGEFI